MSSSSSAPAGASATGAGATATLQPISTADRLALHMQRHAISADNVAQQLAWSPERLREYLDTHKQRVAPLDRADKAVEQLLERDRVARARTVIESTRLLPIAPLQSALHRSTTPSSTATSSSANTSTLLMAAPSYSSLLQSQLLDAANASSQSHPHANRKRKRRVESKRVASELLHASSSTTASSIHSRTIQSDALCPIRIDVDVDGVRFIDTLLLDAVASSYSPEAIAASIARDERLSDRFADAIAESIRRQLTTFLAVSSGRFEAEEALHPIVLDVVIDGLALRDQFEWDISHSFHDVEVFTATLCVDLSLPQAFERAIVFSIWDQVTAFRSVRHAHRWIASSSSATTTTARGKKTPVTSDFVDVLPPLVDVEDVERDAESAKLWTPVLSELTTNERQTIATRVAAARRPSSLKRPIANGHTSKRTAASSSSSLSTTASSSKQQRDALSTTLRMRRPLNAFIMFCQVQKDTFARLKPRRAASETRKLMGDEWRRMTDEDKEVYNRLAEAENEKRRREQVVAQRDAAIAQWEDEDARRRGLLSDATLDATPDYTRNVLLANYVHERHDVDQRRATVRLEDDDDAIDNDDGKDEDDVDDDE